MRSINVDIDPLDPFCIDIPGNMVSFVNDKYALPGIRQLPRTT